MSPEERLNRLERVMKMTLRSGQRSRSNFAFRIDAVIDAQIRGEYSFNKRFARLSRSQDRTDEEIRELKASINKLLASQEKLLASQEELVASQKEFVASQKELVTLQKEFVASQREFVASQKEFAERVSETDQRMKETDERLRKLIDIVGRAQ